jgi:hypothetical protein
LDFFINKSNTFDEQLESIFALLKKNDFTWSEEKEFIRNNNFASISVQKSDFETQLKLDFVNDLVPHFGELVNTDLFYRTDSVRNILSNKLSAIFRYAAKDVADIREIVLHENVDWAETIGEAREKEAGLDFGLISEILSGMPEQEFNTINWVKKTEWAEFKSDIDRVVYEMMSCAE